MILTGNIPKVQNCVINHDSSIISHYMYQFLAHRNSQAPGDENNISVNKTRPNDYEGWIIFDQFKRPMGSLGDYLKNQERV